MKKLPVILAATALVASVGAYAQPLKNDASPFAVNVPNLKSGFEFNVEGLFLKPSNSDLDYGNITHDFDDDFQDSVLTVKPDTDFAWGVGVGYVFPDSGNDVQLSWTGFSHTDRDNLTLTAANAISGVFPVLETPFDNEFSPEDFNNNDDIVTAAIAARSKLSAVDLNVGQYIDVGNRLQLRPFAGLRFASVESNLTNSYAEDDRTGNVQGLLTENDVFNSKFNGIGPLLGADVNYQLGGGVGASAHLATALLVGKAKTNSHFNSSEYDYIEGTPVLDDSDSATIRSNDVTRVVPAFDAKLGLNYSYTFDCESVVTLEGGYKVTQYIDAVDRLKGLDQLDNESADTTTRTTTSLGFSGPYVKLSLKI